MESTLPLVQRYNISKDEVDSSSKKVRFMLQVMKQNNLKEEYVTKIYEEWVTVAKRLKKGREMIEQTEQTFPTNTQLDTNDRFKNLMNLYSFLLSVLGFYDTFFKMTLSEPHHKKLQSAILEILR